MRSQIAMMPLGSGGTGDSPVRARAPRSGCSALAAARTGGSLAPYTDLNLKRLIDSGRCPAPGCTSPDRTWKVLARSPRRCREMIADLVKHHVAITSTLAVLEAFDGYRPPLEDRFFDALTAEASVSYLTALAGFELLGEQDRFGAIHEGKSADLVVIDGNPAANISDIRKIQYVFKDGAGYDPAKLLDSVRGAGLQPAAPVFCRHCLPDSATGSSGCAISSPASLP